jgi:4-oxalomesaconate tautomerase
VLLAAMGSPDPRQIDGLGGADSLTSKVAIVSPSSRPDADVDYLFLQVSVAEALVSDRQNCGNLLAGVGPFALERGLVPAVDGVTDVRIFMRNTDGLATARIQTPGGEVDYAGDCRIDGVPGSAAPIPITFADVAGSTCGALLPTGPSSTRSKASRSPASTTACRSSWSAPAIWASAGDEPRDARSRRDLARAGRGDPPGGRPAHGPGRRGRHHHPQGHPGLAARAGGALSTRSFIPHTVHKAIGVFGAVSVATAACLPGSVAASVARLPATSGEVAVSVEHPTGEFTALLTLSDAGEVVSAALLRTARLLMIGQVMVPQARSGMAANDPAHRPDRLWRGRPDPGSRPADQGFDDIVGL